MATQAKLISGTDFITVATQDYERAAEFYGETLGLEFSKRWGSMPAAFFDDPDGNALAIHHRYAPADPAS